MSAEINVETIRAMMKSSFQEALAEATDSIREMLEDEDDADCSGARDDDMRDEELEDVLRILRADSSHALLCGHDAAGEYITKLIARLERKEHRQS